MLCRQEEQRRAQCVRVGPRVKLSHRSSLFRVVLLGATVLCSSLVTSSRAVADGGLTDRLRRAFLAQPAVARRSGLRVVSLPDEKVVYSSPRAGEPFIPASNQKLLVSAAALERLGPAFRWTTRLARCGDDLVVFGAGDPATGDPRLAAKADEPITAMFDRWAQALEDQGITHVTGDLIVDDAAFDDQWVHPNWSAGDLQRWYGAPVGGLNFNNNCIDVTVIPGGRPGAATTVEVMPPNDLVRIINRSRTAASGVPVISRKGLTHEFILTGTCAKRSTLTSAPVVDPSLFFASAFRTALGSAGIRIDGVIRREILRRSNGTLPASCGQIAVHESALTDALGRMNKQSQNFFAECVLKTLGHHAMGRKPSTGTWSAGAEVVRRFVASVSSDPTGLVIDDGSGLSRHNRVTPRQLTDVLVHLYQSRSRDAFVESLSVAGVDGTLRRRAGMRSIKGQVKAKTGYISGVRTLSGYVEAKSGQWFAFSFLFNDAGPKRIGTSPATRLQDKICGILARE